MMRKKLAILTILLMSVLTLASDRVASTGPAEMLNQAAVMPKGALIYVQSRNLGAQLQAWQKSAVRSRYYKSDSHKAFLRSRLALKFEERLGEFEGNVGAALSEENLLALAGGKSALALYNIGELEMIFITELSGAKAKASALIASAVQLEPRTYAGTTYYAKNVTSEFGQERSFAFATVGNRIVLASSETLMRRALKNLAEKDSNDRLLETIVATAEKAEGFEARDLTLWLDQAALNNDRYFRNYWIHNNVKGLAAIDKVLIDLELSSEGMKERRWLTSESATATAAAGGFQELLRFVPADTQLVSAHATAADRAGLYDELQALLVGKTNTSALPADNQAAYTAPVREASETGDGTQEFRRYIYLDERFDQDIDSDELKITAVAAQPDNARFAAALTNALTPAAPARFTVMAEPVVDQSSLFVRFNKALAIELGQPAKLARENFETAVAQELQRRFIVQGGAASFAWTGEAGGARVMEQTLIEHGGAYSVVNNFLIIANSREYLDKILAAYQAAPETKVATQPGLARYAFIKVRAGRSAYDQLMKRLDGNAQNFTPPAGEDDEERFTESIPLFSKNISSLLGVVAGIDSVTYERLDGAGVIREQVNYRYAVDAPARQ